MLPRPRLLAAVVLAASAAAAPAAAPAPKSAADAPTFETHVRPLLKAYCTDCHGEEAKPKGGLDLRLRRLMVEGGDTGPAVVPGKPDDSPLFTRVRDGEMPPGKKKLTAAEVDVLRRWIASGAKTERDEPKALGVGMPITDEDRNWWAFRPVTRPAVPPTAAHPVDAFVRQALADKGLSPNPEADRRTLVRRLTFDLHGLPPTPAEVDAFANDRSADAYEKLVDRLLASPRYGERWGRHWLDVAGYADSEGYDQADPVRETAWKYRDYVVRSFNADKPFDRFVTEQLAGDELVKRPYADLSADDRDRLTATGFLRMAPDGTGNPGVDQKAARNAVVNDTVRIVSSAFLGLTVGCAQCHNHRFDPIPQADYYRLRAAFEPAFDPAAWKPPAARQVSLLSDADKKKAAGLEAEAKAVDAARLKRQDELIAATLEKEFAKLPEDVREKARAAKAAPAAKLTAEQKALLQRHPSLNVNPGSLYLYDKKAADELKAMTAKAAEIRAKKPAAELIRAAAEDGKAVPPTFLFHRGDPDQPKEQVPPGGLAVLDERLPLPAVKPSVAGSSGRRLALAAWLTDPRHPLTARVFVNRVWMHHFGRGLVGSPGDFGRLGEAPTHPELLDWLAQEFLSPSKPTQGVAWANAQPWSLKHLHRLIVTSATYRASSARTPSLDAADPDNRLLGRYPVRRLDAEAVRDGVLATAGTLSDKMFGPPVPVMEDDTGMVVLGKANRDGAGYKLGDETLGAAEAGRRSVYVQVRRSRPLAVLEAFDWATVEPNCEARTSSTVALQSLMLLNNEFVVAQSEAFADRLKKEAGGDATAQLTLAWRLAYGVAPTAAELERATAFVAGQTAAFASRPEMASASVSAAPVKAKPKTAAKAPPAPPRSPADRALAAFCQAVLMSNRFLYVD